MRRVWAMVLVVLLTAIASGCACSTDVSGDPPAPIEFVEGELLSLEFDRQLFGDDHYRAVIQTESGEVEFLVAGRYDVLGVGQRYEFGLSVYEDGGEPVAFLAAEGRCGGSRTTIRQLDDDGNPFDIETPRRIPTWPISRNQLFLGFGGLALLTFVFRQR